ERADEHPVIRVDWNDAQQFCRWLGEKEGRVYRLPTDEEWSHAAGIAREENRTKDATPESVFKPNNVFPWGMQWPPPTGVGNYGDRSRKAKAPRNGAAYLEDYDDGFP